MQHNSATQSLHDFIPSQNLHYYEDYTYTDSEHTISIEVEFLLPMQHQENIRILFL